MSGHVYFAKVGRYVKVGFSRDPEKRVANLFASATRYTRPLDCPTTGAELIATIPGTLDTERRCHLALQDFAAGCEFFIDEPPVREFISAVAAGDFTEVERPGGFFEPPSRITDEDRERLRYALEHMFDGINLGGVA